MYKILRLLIFVCSIVLVLPGNAVALVNYSEFMQHYDAAKGKDKFVFLQFFRGLANGLSWANNYLELNNPKAKIYCRQKSNVVLTTKQEISIMRKFVKKYPKYKTVPPGVSMLYAFKNKWPCR